MNGSIRVSAKTVDDAITEALIQLGVTSDNLEYEVIEKGSAGFLGIGMKQAVIEARRKKGTEEPDILEEMKLEVKREEEKLVKKDNKKDLKKEVKKETKKDTKKPEEKEIVRNEKNSFDKENTSEEKGFIVKNSSVLENKPKEVSENEKVETDKEASGKENGHPKRVIEVAEVTEETKQAVEKFISDTLSAMNMQVQITSSVDKDGILCVEMTGENMGILIGKRGQTLDSLQYLANRVANKYQTGYVRVKLDTENYRARREETLKHLAKNIAHKVKKGRRPIALEPMNPYERRIIHSSLQSDPYVSTHSEGEEPYRKVVVTLKR